MSTKENPHKGGLDAFRSSNPTTLSSDTHATPFAGSLEEQARRLWEQRPAESREASSELPPRRRRYMQLRKLVYASRYDLPTLPERIEAFAAENDLPVPAVTLEAQAIMTEWQGAIRGAQL